MAFSLQTDAKATAKYIASQVKKIYKPFNRARNGLGSTEEVGSEALSTRTGSLSIGCQDRLSGPFLLVKERAGSSLMLAK